MKKGIVFLVLLSGIMLSGLAQEASAQYTAERLYQYLLAVHDRNDGSTTDFLISELTAFGQTFPDDPRAADAAGLLAQVYLEKGKKNEALATAYKTLYLYPRCARETDCRDMIQAILTREPAYAPKKGVLEAAVYGTAIDATMTERWRAYLKLLRDLDQPRLYDWSLAEATRYISRFPGDSLLYTVLEWTGDLYTRLNQEWPAIYSYRKLSELFPDDPQLPYALYQEAQLLTGRVGKHEDAVARCTRILAHYPESELAPTAAYTIGQIKEQKLKDYSGAIEAYRKLVTGWPKDERAVEVLFTIANIQDKRLKKYDLALATYDEILNNFPTDPRGARALELAGDVYADDLKEYLKAAESYARISKLYSADEKAPQMLIQAGNLCEEKLKDPRKAIEYYQMVVDLYPNSKKANDANKLITKATNKAAEKL
ncbi:MAG TPA: tetratricopeptide repeat protein [bacterium]|nr:tetratricopeptide repeat protein [bacterium]HQG46943.1 tetratricopeptide repeat protein [bacterium]HQI47095.1 tetratricopeptide repeat protein [bacterium]HQJ65348.1 tetratricopeptide repeat protein [bacterium]